MNKRSFLFSQKNENVQHCLDFSGTSNLAAHKLSESIFLKTPFCFDQNPSLISEPFIQSIAEHEGVKEECIFIANGSAELIWLSLNLLKPSEVLFLGPISPEYERACLAMDIPVSYIATYPQNDFIFEAKDLEKIWSSRADLIIFASPNPITGAVYPNFHAVAKMIRSPRIMIDASLKEFLFGTDAYQKNKYNYYKDCLMPGVSLFILNTFSDFFACPGLRLSYLLGDYMQIRQLQSARPDYEVSPYAQKMAHLMLSLLDEYRATLPELENMLLHSSFSLLQSGLFNEEQIFNGPSFVSAGLKNPKAKNAVFNELKKHRILPYDCSKVSNMPDAFLRFQARPLADIEIMADCLNFILENPNKN